jgi:cyclopropane fatty-acyl-phospholipid synthase-like methyltransferase
VDSIKKNTLDYYTKTFSEHGDSARGVDWKDGPSQALRFELIVNFMEPADGLSILDVGCGSGAFYQFVTEKYPQLTVHYTGIDWVEDMIDTARQKYPGDNAHFFVSDLKSVETEFDYVIGSGIFNVKQSINEQQWREHILQTLKQMYQRSRRAVVFNVLTKYVDWTVEKLHYSDPMSLFDYCVKELSRHVCIDHSSQLYEYTMAVFQQPKYEDEQ